MMPTAIGLIGIDRRFSHRPT